MNHPVPIRSAIVTGATGAIGLKLIELLARNSVRMLLIARPGSPRNALLPSIPEAAVAECGLQGMAGLEMREQWDAFFHLGWLATEDAAARNDTAAQTINIACAMDAVELAARAGCTVFVGAGSQAEHGRFPDGVVGVHTPVAPVEAYGVAKYAAGGLSRIRCRQLGIRHCWTRILSVYGEHCPSRTLIMYAIDSLLRGDVPEFTPCGQVWDYLYAGDCAQALWNVAVSGSDGAVYPLGGGSPRELREYIETIRLLINPRAEVRYGARPYPEGQVMRMVADMEPLEYDTGYRPGTSFSDGVLAIVWSKGKKQ